MFQESVARWPDNIALVCAHQAANLYDIPSVPTPSLQGVEGSQIEERRPYLRWTFQSLESGVDRLKVGLRSLGVRPGMAVVTFMPNCAEYVLTWWATRRMGLVMAPVNPRGLSNREEVAHMLATIMEGTGGQPPILIAFEQEIFESEPLKSVHSFAKIVVSTVGRQPQSEGVLFGDLMSTREIDGNADGCQQDERPTDDEILFTSGSTSRPKGIKIEHPILSLGMRDFAETPGCETQPGDLWLALTPNNHGMGRGTLTSSMCFGAGTVYPSFYFNVEDAADALLRERCTHAALVPTFIRLLADAVGPRLRKTAPDSCLLKTIFLSGAPPTAADMQECVDILGIQSISSVYGMTEGAEANTPAYNDWTKLLNDEGMISVGTPRSRGAAIKICAPDATGPDRPPLPSGMPGEIHYTGIERLPLRAIYMEKPDTDDFCYTDGQGWRWFVTGDRGVIRDGKQLYIIGRSKDMIVRGGENIAPAAIESCLARNPTLAHLSIQIVGAPDAIAGEVPVAVVATSAEELKRVAKEIHQTVVKEMGPIFMPSEIIPLEALGLTDWPRTLTGKIRKAEVTELVNKLLQDGEYSESSGTATPGRDEQLASKVLDIWARSVGLEETSLSIDQPISEFADSLTIARVIRRLRRTVPGCGSISAQDIARTGTIKAQIDLIVSLASVPGNAHNGELGANGPATRVSAVERFGPPGVEEMVSFQCLLPCSLIIHTPCIIAMRDV
jgi:acyl-CoA synthetase (AMP-forming)/AMP-acid ligase II